MPPTNPVKRMLRRHRMRSLLPEWCSSSTEPGKEYLGPVAYSTDPVIGPPGYYATHPETHQIIPGLRLTAMPTTDGKHFFVAAHPDEPYYAQSPALPNRPISLEAHITGKSNLHT